MRACSAAQLKALQRTLPIRRTRARHSMRATEKGWVARARASLFPSLYRSLSLRVPLSPSVSPPLLLCSSASLSVVAGPSLLSTGLATLAPSPPMMGGGWCHPHGATPSRTRAWGCWVDTPRPWAAWPPRSSPVFAVFAWWRCSCACVCAASLRQTGVAKGFTLLCSSRKRKPNASQREGKKIETRQYLFA